MHWHPKSNVIAYCCKGDDEGQSETPDFGHRAIDTQRPCVGRFLPLLACELTPHRDVISHTKFQVDRARVSGVRVIGAQNPVFPVNFDNRPNSVTLYDATLWWYLFMDKGVMCTLAWNDPSLLKFVNLFQLIHQFMLPPPDYQPWRSAHRYATDR